MTRVERVIQEHEFETRLMFKQAICDGKFKPKEGEDK